MAYRRTERVLKRLAARHDAIVAAAEAIASEAGMASVQIMPVAARAGIAAGTVYRYFPGKSDLVAAMIAAVSARELSALRRAGSDAPGPLSALAATIATFAIRALRQRRLAWAVIAEPVDMAIDTRQLAYRKALASEFEARIRAAIAGAHLPETNAALAAAALVGALIEALIGPLASEAGNDAAAQRDSMQMLTLLSLRALGVIDAHARGLVIQIPVPVDETAGTSSEASLSVT